MPVVRQGLFGRCRSFPPGNYSGSPITAPLRLLGVQSSYIICGISPRALFKAFSGFFMPKIRTTLPYQLFKHPNFFHSCLCILMVRKLLLLIQPPFQEKSGFLETRGERCRLSPPPKGSAMDKDRQKNRPRSQTQTSLGQGNNQPSFDSESFQLEGLLSPACTTAASATPTYACEILTVEQLAERLQVCRATIFNLIQRDVLLPGVHYFKLGRSTRFPWTAQLITNLLQMSIVSKPQNSVVKPATKPVRRSNSNPINWEY